MLSLMTLGDRTRYTLSKFGYDTKLGRAVSIPEDRAATLRGLDSIKKWVRKNLMMFKSEVQGLTSRMEYPHAKYRLGPTF